MFHGKEIRTLSNDEYNNDVTKVGVIVKINLHDVIKEYPSPHLNTENSFVSIAAFVEKNNG